MACYLLLEYGEKHGKNYFSSTWTDTDERRLNLFRKIRPFLERVRENTSSRGKKTSGTRS